MRFLNHPIIHVVESVIYTVGSASPAKVFAWGVGGSGFALSTVAMGPELDGLSATLKLWTLGFGLAAAITAFVGPLIFWCIRNWTAWKHRDAPPKL